MLHGVSHVMKQIDVLGGLPINTAHMHVGEPDPELLEIPILGRPRRPHVLNTVSELVPGSQGEEQLNRGCSGASQN